MNVQDRINRRTDTITAEFGGLLRCETCGKQAPVEPAYWHVGWPKHCGQTMRWWTQRQIDAGEMPPQT